MVDGTTAAATAAAPVQVSGLTDVEAVAVGGRHSCALRTGGQVACWGDGWAGQLGTGDENSSLTPISPGAFTGFTQISANGYYTCGVRNGGEVWCWGYDVREPKRALSMARTETESVAAAASRADAYALLATGAADRAITDAQAASSNLRVALGLEAPPRL